MNRYINLMIGVLVLFVACKGKNDNTVAVANQAIQVDSLPGQCPYLTKDNKGNTVLSWVRMLNDSSAVFCYAVAADGKTFGQPVVIPNSNNIQPHVPYRVCCL